MDPIKEILDEKKLGLLQKYRHTIKDIILLSVIVFLFKWGDGKGDRINALIQDQLKSEQEKNKDLLEINRLSRELEQQARTLNSQTDNRLSNQKSVK
jgi:hypothetical protein